MNINQSSLWIEKLRSLHSQIINTLLFEHHSYLPEGVATGVFKCYILPALRMASPEPAMKRLVRTFVGGLIHISLSPVLTC